MNVGFPHTPPSLPSSVLQVGYWLVCSRAETLTAVLGWGSWQHACHWPPHIPSAPLWPQTLWTQTSSNHPNRGLNPTSCGWRNEERSITIMLLSCSTINITFQCLVQGCQTHFIQCAAFGLHRGPESCTENWLYFIAKCAKYCPSFWEFIMLPDCLAFHYVIVCTPDAVHLYTFCHNFQ